MLPFPAALPGIQICIWPGHTLPSLSLHIPALIRAEMPDCSLRLHSHRLPDTFTQPFSAVGGHNKAVWLVFWFFFPGEINGSKQEKNYLHIICCPTQIHVYPIIIIMNMETA